VSTCSSLVPSEKHTFVLLTNVPSAAVVEDCCSRHVALAIGWHRAFATAM